MRLAVQNCAAMNWDDLRYVVTLSSSGSLAKAARVLGVDHTTVGRRVDAAERALGVRLFTRTPAGYVPTADAERLLAPMRQVEEAVLAVERGATAHSDALEGVVRVTSPETFGVSWLSPRLAKFGLRHPGLEVQLVPAGEVLDLGRRQAEVAVRFFRSKQAGLAVRRAGEVSYGLYASHEYLARRPLRQATELHQHRLLTGPPGDLEMTWLEKLNPSAQPAFTSTLSLALLEAAKSSAGVAVLPRYLGDAQPSLQHLPMPDAPSETLWLTVHRDLRQTPRIRALLDFLVKELGDDAARLRGA